MDPVVFMEGKLNIRTLILYLGPNTTAEQKIEANEQGLKLLQLYGVIPTRNTPAFCPECHRLLETVRDGTRLYGWRYTCKNHKGRMRYSPLLNTFLSRVRLGSEMGADRVVLVMFWWFLQLPLKHLQEQLSFSSETAVYWYKFCRDVACAIAWHDYVPIGGDMDVVEVNESPLFKKKNESGHISVVGGISRTTKKRFALIVPRWDADTLLPLLHECINDRSYICTDYRLEDMDFNVIFNGHGSVNYNFVHPPKGEPPIWMPPGRFNKECLDSQWDQPPPEPGMQPFRISTQNIKRSWVDLKDHLKSSNSQDYVSQYIGEWMYRQNILDEIVDKKQQFERFLQDVKRVYPGVGKNPMQKRYEDIMDCDCHECQPYVLEEED